MPTSFSKETYLYWYELMQLIRQFELKAEEMYKMAGKIRGFFHAYIGQEAIAAGPSSLRASRASSPRTAPIRPPLRTCQSAVVALPFTVQTVERGRFLVRAR